MWPRRGGAGSAAGRPPLGRNVWPHQVRDLLWTIPWKQSCNNWLGRKVRDWKWPEWAPLEAHAQGPAGPSCGSLRSWARPQPQGVDVWEGLFRSGGFVPPWLWPARRLGRGGRVASLSGPFALHHPREARRPPDSLRRKEEPGTQGGTLEAQPLEAGQWKEGDVEPRAQVDPRPERQTPGASGDPCARPGGWSRGGSSPGSWQARAAGVERAVHECGAAEEVGAGQACRFPRVTRGVCSRLPSAAVLKFLVTLGRGAFRLCSWALGNGMDEPNSDPAWL